MKKNAQASPRKRFPAAIKLPAGEYIIQVTVDGLGRVVKLGASRWYAAGKEIVELRDARDLAGEGFRRLLTSPAPICRPRKR